MPDYIKGIQAFHCGVDSFVIRFTMDEDTTTLTLPDPALSSSEGFMPVMEGEWEFYISNVTVGEFTTLEPNMAILNIKQRALCGLINPELYGSMWKTSPTGFIFPCTNDDGTLIPGADCNIVSGWDAPYAAWMVPYDIYGGTTVDCCTGGSITIQLSKTDVECPVADCTLLALQFVAGKTNGIDPFWLQFNINGEWIAPPP